MKNKILASLATLLSLTGMVTTVYADPISVDVYQVGSNPGGLARDYNNPGLPTDYGEINEGGVSIIEWTFEDVLTAGVATLTITAEGVDLGEFDKVFFNGQEIGFLTQQTTGTPSFVINPGAGVNPGVTYLTISTFTVDALQGDNTVRIEVASGDWVNEIQTSTLTVTPVPEPTTIILFGTGLLGLTAIGRRKRS